MKKEENESYYIVGHDPTLLDISISPDLLEFINNLPQSNKVLSLYLKYITLLRKYGTIYLQTSVLPNFKIYTDTEIAEIMGWSRNTFYKIKKILKETGLIYVEKIKHQKTKKILKNITLVTHVVSAPKETDYGRRVNIDGLLMSQCTKKRYSGFFNGETSPLKEGNRSTKNWYTPTNTNINNKSSICSNNNKNKNTKNKSNSIFPDEIVKTTSKQIETLLLPKHLQTTNFKEAWEDWKQYRKEMKFKESPSITKMHIKRISQFNSKKACEVIEQAISKEYKCFITKKQYEESKSFFKTKTNKTKTPSFKPIKSTDDKMTLLLANKCNYDPSNQWIVLCTNKLLDVISKAHQLYRDYSTSLPIQMIGSKKECILSFSKWYHDQEWIENKNEKNLDPDGKIFERFITYYQKQTDINFFKKTRFF